MSAFILCIIDCSESSKNALQWAIAKANLQKSHLVVLYPYRLTLPQNGESVIDMRKKIEDEAKIRFGVLEKDFLLKERISYEFKTEVGFLADRVEEHIRDHTVSFLVIDKNITKLNKESFDELVENTRVPMVIVP